MNDIRDREDSIRELKILQLKLETEVAQLERQLEKMEQEIVKEMDNVGAIR